MNKANILLFKHNGGISDEPSDEFGDGFGDEVELEPGEVGNMPGAVGKLIKPADGIAETLFIVERVRLNSDAKEDTRPLIELKRAASAEGLKGSSVIRDLGGCISLCACFFAGVSSFHS